MADIKKEGEEEKKARGKYVDLKTYKVGNDNGNFSDKKLGNRRKLTHLLGTINSDRGWDATKGGSELEKEEDFLARKGADDMEDAGFSEFTKKVSGMSPKEREDMLLGVRKNTEALSARNKISQFKENLAKKDTYGGVREDAGQGGGGEWKVQFQGLNKRGGFGEGRTMAQKRVSALKRARRKMRRAGIPWKDKESREAFVNAALGPQINRAYADEERKSVAEDIIRKRDVINKDVDDFDGKNDLTANDNGDSNIKQAGRASGVQGANRANDGTNSVLRRKKRQRTA